MKTPSLQNTRAVNRAPLHIRKQTKPRQNGLFKRFTLLIVDFLKERFVWARRKTDTTDADHDKRIAENYVFDEVLVSMFHARSLKDALSLTITKHHKKQESMVTNQILTRLFVSQIVLSKNKRRSINTWNLYCLLVENLLCQS